MYSFFFLLKVHLDILLKILTKIHNHILKLLQFLFLILWYQLRHFLLQINQQFILILLHIK